MLSRLTSSLGNFPFLQSVWTNFKKDTTNAEIYVGEWGWGVEGKQVGSMDEESQVRGCYNITFICTPTNQETVSVLEKTQANKTFRT